MLTVDFKEVAKLINNSRVTYIDLNPIQHDDGKWALYKGVNKVPHFDYHFHILYLYEAATINSIENANSVIKTIADTTQVVFFPDLNKKFKSIELKSLFTSNVAGLRDTSEYLKSFVLNQLRAYLNKLIENVKTENFVPPIITPPNGMDHKTPSPVKLFLDSTKGAVGVLIAEPGQGKTYSVKDLSSKIASSSSNKYIPIYIDSPQWQNLSSEDLASVWKTITHSFKYFDAGIDWIDGCEEEFLYVTLKAGLFRIIFDGFDEYILWNRGKVEAQETIRSIIKLAKETDTPILLTSRTSFWEQNVDFTLLDSNGIMPEIYELKPFDQNHAKIYFKQRLKENDLINRALGVYDSLLKAGSSENPMNFVGRGFTLNLIADLISRTESNPEFVKTKSTAIQWLMKSLCQREVKRQKLPINEEQQLTILREFAEETSRSKNGLVSSPNTDLLRNIIGCCVDNLDEKQINKLLSTNPKDKNSLQDHPLIRRDMISDEWYFTHEQIRFNLLAEQIIYYVKDKKESSLKMFFDELIVEGSIITDLSNTIVDQIFAVNITDDITDDIKKVINSLITCCGTYDDYQNKYKSERVLATSIAMLTLNRRLAAKSAPHKDRTNEFITYFSNKSLVGLYFNETISSMDLRNVTFKKCVFDNTVWANCDFDESTVFDNCYFIGGKVVNCKSFGKSRWIKEYFDLEAKSLIDSERIIAGNKKYTKDDLKSDIDVILRKFIPREAAGFKPVYPDYITSGMIARAAVRDQIFTIVSAKLLTLTHKASSPTSQCYVVNEDAKSSLTDYMNNGVFTGVLAEVFEDLFHKIKL